VNQSKDADEICLDDASWLTDVVERIFGVRMCIYQLDCCFIIFSHSDFKFGGTLCTNVLRNGCVISHFATSDPHSVFDPPTSSAEYNISRCSLFQYSNRSYGKGNVLLYKEAGKCIALQFRLYLDNWSFCLIQDFTRSTRKLPMQPILDIIGCVRRGP
jgi:hypothetical protein